MFVLFLTALATSIATGAAYAPPPPLRAGRRGCTRRPRHTALGLAGGGLRTVQGRVVKDPANPLFRQVSMLSFFASPLSPYHCLPFSDFLRWCSSLTTTIITI